jgi:hypothetical protein
MRIMDALRAGQDFIVSMRGQSLDVGLSSTESEIIWICNAATQVSFTKQFVDEMNIFKSTTFELLEDSQPAINTLTSIAKS